jgi:hypothetical protein
MESVEFKVFILFMFQILCCSRMNAGLAERQSLTKQWVEASKKLVKRGHRANLATSKKKKRF